MLIWYQPGLFIFTVPPFVIAAFAELRGKREYVVAQKVSSERSIKSLNMDDLCDDEEIESLTE